MSHDPRTLRLAIVGAGPSGLSLAWYLSQLGFTDVTLFDAADAVGGQSQTHDIDGIPIEMGTCYLADGYVIAREIAQAAGVTVERLPPATFLDTNGRPYVPPRPSLWSLARYVWHWFGWWLRDQLWHPTDPANALTFAAWLQARGLGDLAVSSVFADACTAQLYGPVDVVSAHNGLAWVRPSLLLTGLREDTAHIPQGFQTMWRRLVAKLGYPVRLGTAVRGVHPVGEGSRRQVEVEFAADGRRERFDHVFVACPLDAPAGAPPAIATPVGTLVDRDGPFDDSAVYSAIWRARGWSPAVPSRCYLPACTKGERGRLLTIRQYGQVGDEWVGQLCAYVADGPTPEARLETTRRQVTDDMATLVGLRDIRFVTDKVWRYNIRYSAAQLRGGIPAALYAKDGDGHVWYAGGGLSHWDVDMISNYSQSLAWCFSGAVGISIWDRLGIFRLRDLLRSL